MDKIYHQSIIQSRCLILYASWFCNLPSYNSIPLSKCKRSPPTPSLLQLWLPKFSWSQVRHSSCLWTSEASLQRRYWTTPCQNSCIGIVSFWAWTWIYTLSALWSVQIDRYSQAYPILQKIPCFDWGHQSFPHRRSRRKRRRQCRWAPRRYW